MNAPTVCDDLPKKNESYVGIYIKVKTNVKKFTKTDTQGLNFKYQSISLLQPQINIYY